jgi:hypothetical protein
MAHSASTLGPIFTPGPGTGYLRPELHGLKIIGVEEHAAFPEIMKRIPNEGAARHAREMIGHMTEQESGGFARGRVTNISTQRVTDMDEGGIAMQVLSTTGAINSTFLEPEAGLALSRDINNAFKQAVDANREAIRGTCRSARPCAAAGYPGASPLRQRAGVCWGHVHAFHRWLG